MFTVIEGEPVLHNHASHDDSRYYTFPVPRWIVWCGWQDAYSATWSTLEEACRDAALKEWTYQLATGQATGADQRTR